MLEASVQTIGSRDKKANFALLSLYPAEDARQNQHKNLQIINAKPFRLALVIVPLAVMYRFLPFVRGFLKKRSPAIKAMAEADILLDQGGITFSDGREPFLLYNVASILPAIIMKVPILKCAQALGPFKNPINRVVSKIFLPKIRLIVARGSYTLDNLNELGLKNTVLGADYAFSLDLTNEAKKNLAKQAELSRLKGKSKIVGISPSVVLRKQCLKQGIDYQKIITNFINDLVAKGYFAVLVAHSARGGSDKLHNNDLPLCRQIYDSLKDKKQCLFVDKELGSEELRWLIGEFDLFVASRFHAMVSSLSVGVPTLVIGWSHKYAEVLRMFDLEEYAFKYQLLSAEKLTGKFTELEDDKENIARKISTNLPKVKKQSLKHLEYISQIIGK